MKNPFSAALDFLENAELILKQHILDKKVSVDLKEIRISLDIVITDLDPDDDTIKLFNRGTKKE